MGHQDISHALKGATGTIEGPLLRDHGLPIVERFAARFSVPLISAACELTPPARPPPPVSSMPRNFQPTPPAPYSAQSFPRPSKVHPPLLLRRRKTNRPFPSVPPLDALPDSPSHCQNKNRPPLPLPLLLSHQPWTQKRGELSGVDVIKVQTTHRIVHYCKQTINGRYWC